MLAAAEEWISLEMAITVSPINMVACGSCTRVGKFDAISACTTCSISRFFDVSRAMQGGATMIVTTGEKNPIAPRRK